MADFYPTGTRLRQMHRPYSLVITYRYGGLMELRHLRYFVAVSDAGGVSRAALGLNISQPALSRQIRDLEAELGVSLFERRTGRLVLTGEGEELLARSRELLSDAESLRERASSRSASPAGATRRASCTIR